MRQVAALGRDKNLVSSDETLLDRPPDGASDGALALLTPVVDRRIQNVDPGAEGEGRARLVALVRGGVFAAQIGPETDRGHGNSRCLAKVSESGLRSRNEPACAFE